MGDERSLEGTVYTEWAEGTVQCSQCGYWGSMQGFVSPDDDKFIMFVCPVDECQAVEKVRNPLS